MKRVPKSQLRAGLVLAERVVDAKYKVLLEANARLSEEHVEKLKTWDDIDFVRICEPTDTPEALIAQLKEDRLLEQKEKGYRLREKRAVAKLELGITEENIRAILVGQGDDRLHSDERDIKKMAAGFRLASLLEPKALEQYQRMLYMIARLFQEDPRSRDLFFKTSNELAVKICGFVEKTTGVMGYGFYPHKIVVAELAAHTMRTSIFAGKIAQLMGFDNKAMKVVVQGAMMHDVGLSALPVPLRRRTEIFSPDEEKVYQKHVFKSLVMLKGLPGIPQEAVLAVGGHHEKMNGSGYPLRLYGRKIHPYARIVALADKLDSVMYPEDVLGRGYSLTELIAEIPFWSIEYDPNMCAVLRLYLEEFMMCNRVLLSDGRRGDVIWRHGKYNHPLVRANDGDIVDVNKAAGLKIERYSL